MRRRIPNTWTCGLTGGVLLLALSGCGAQSPAGQAGRPVANVTRPATTPGAVRPANAHVGPHRAAERSGRTAAVRRHQARTRSAHPTTFKARLPAGFPPPVAVHYRAVGTGNRVVVLVHGGPGSNFPQMLHAFSPLVRQGYRVVYYDQRGTGLSPRPRDGRYGPRAYLADLEALRQRLGVRRIDLIGNSWGGFVAASYAARFPRHVGSVVEIGGLPFSGSAQAAGNRHYSAKLYRLQQEGLVPWKIPGPVGDDCTANTRAQIPVFAGNPAHPGPYRILAGPPITCSQSVYDRAVAALGQSSALVSYLTARLRGWPGRAILVMGGHDPFGRAWLRADAAQYAAARVTRIVVPGAGHCTWLDDPALVPRLGRLMRSGGAAMPGSAP